ncbi:MAG: tetratricopeptide repeat protein [Bryobacteraceae bacterium]|jgi:tetratricopeptide (TPR) repeat protein
MIRSGHVAVVFSFLACVAAVTPAFCQDQAAAPPAANKPDNRAAAYYAFAMAHLNGELASAYGNRGEYVNKAIDFYQQAMKLDPDASYIAEELADFYIQAGQIERATQLANDLIKKNPDNGEAHKILARIYARQIGDPDQGQGRVDQAMLKAAVAEYEKITQLNPKDTESLSMLARLYRVSHNEAGAERAYRAVIAADPNDDEALSGLAAVYADRGDMADAIQMLKQAVDKNPDPRTVTTLAEFYEQDKQFSNAADAWKMALPLTNDNVQVRRHYAATLLAADRADEALKAFQDLEAEDPKNPELELQLVDLYEHKRDFASAHAALAKAQAIENGPEVRAAEADLLDAEGKTAQAVTILQGLLTDSKKTQYTDQERAQRIELLGHLASMQGKIERTPDAAATLRQISELNPGAASKVEIQIVKLYAFARDYKDARQVADAALKKFPNDRLVAMTHAGVLSEQEQYDAALNELRAMPDAATDRDVLLQIAQVQDKARRFNDERKTLDAAEAASTTPQEKQGIIFVRGELLEEMGQFDAAIGEFQKLPNAGKDRAALLQIAQVQDKAKRFEDETKTLEAAEAISTTDQERQDITFARGAMFERQKKYDDAEEQFKKVLARDPNNASALNYFGYMLAERGVRLEEAQQLIAKALEIQPGEGAYLDSLGWVYFRQNRLDQAAELLRKALDKIGNDATVHDHLGEVYFKQGKIREAIQQWEASVSEMKSASPSEQDPEELSKVSKKLEDAKVRVAEKK